MTFDPEFVSEVRAAAAAGDREAAALLIMLGLEKPGSITAPTETLN